MGGDSGPHKPVHEPTTDIQFGENETGDGAVLAPPRHRFRLDDGGVSAAPQSGGPKHARRYGGGLRSDPGSQSSGPSGAHQVRPLSCAAGSPRVHSKSGRLAEKTRHPNIRRQGGATRRDDGAGGGLRAGLPALLVWLPAGPLSSSGAPHFAERSVGEATLLGSRYRHTQVFRFDPALGPSNVPRPKSHGWRHPEDDR